MIEVPVVMINFKTYNESSGKNAQALAKTALRVSKAKKKNIICVVQAADICQVSKTGMTTFAQHVDTFLPGQHTGSVSLKSLKENGATGCLVNHSENRLSHEQLLQTLALLQEADLVSVVCVQTPKEAKRIAKLHPDMIAIEPPKLIGGNISVTKADPKIITKAIQEIQKVSVHIPVLCGAGVKGFADVKTAKKLGAQGVLVASHVTKAKNKQKEIEQLVKGL